MNEQKETKKRSRNQNAVAMILGVIGVSALMGLLLAAFIPFSNGGGFLEDWLIGSSGMLALCGGYPIGGLLMLVFRKWDEKFCEKAGKILWYGTWIGGYELTKLLEFSPGIGVFIAAFVISALACLILKQWGENGEGKEEAKTSLILILSLAVAYFALVEMRGYNIEKALAPEKEQEAYEIAYNDGYQRGLEHQLETDREELTIDGRSIVDIVELVYDHYGMTPQEACGIIDEYNYDGTHGGFTWEEYSNAIEAAVATAMYFPPME